MKNPNCEVTIGFQTFSLTIKGEENAQAIRSTLHKFKTEEERRALGLKMSAFMSDYVTFNKLLVTREKSLIIGRQYGILTMGGAMSGLYEIAKCVKLNADIAVF